MNHIAALQGSALKGRWRQVNDRARMGLHRRGPVRAGAGVIDGRMHDEGPAGKVSFLSVAQRKAHPVTGRGRRHVIVHHLQ
jgi:hypothetical protein